MTWIHIQLFISDLSTPKIIQEVLQHNPNMFSSPSISCWNFQSCNDSTWAVKENEHYFLCSIQQSNCVCSPYQVQNQHYKSSHVAGNTSRIGIHVYKIYYHTLIILSSLNLPIWNVYIAYYYFVDAIRL